MSAPELPQELRLASQFLTSLAVGLLLGLQRERTPSAKAGLRTFALVALFGTVAALLAETTHSLWLLVAGLVLVGAMIIAAYADQTDPAADSGTTTVVAVVLCYCLGAMIWYGYQQLAVALAIGATMLLHFKTELHGWSARLTPQDIASALQFAALSFIILPLLPDRGYGPYAALNPYHIWLMVVLISGVGLAGYVALRFVGEGQGALATGLLGGLVSSTATTLAFARQARGDARLVGVASVAVMLASLVALVRLGMIVAVVAPALAQRVAAPLSVALLVGLSVALPQLRRILGTRNVSAPEFANPTNLRVSIGFGFLYALVLLLSAWLSERVGSAGLYGLALVSGLTDIDAISLSSARLASAGSVSLSQASTAIAIAVGANLAFKTVLVFVLGNAALGKRCAPALLLTALGVAVGAWTK